MQKKTRLRLRDVLVVIICLAITSGSLYLFWKDLNSSSVRKDKEQIATIEFKRKIAQRKYNDRVVWERLQQNSPLYDSDTIRTAEDAAATVTFSDGTVLELHENTMLQVSYAKDGSLNIAVNGGNIDVDTTSASESSKKVALTMENGSTLKLDAGSKVAASSNTGSGDNSFKVQAGNATVTSTDGKTEQKITSGETVMVDAAGEVKKEPLTVTSISSNAKLLIFNNEKTLPVKLQWNASDVYEKEKIIVETSGDKYFESITKKYTAENKNFVNLNSGVGKTYWRVYPESDKTLATQGKITVERVAPVEITAPLTGSSFTYRKDAELPKLQFMWSGNDYAEYYHLVISKAADLSSPIVDEQVKQTQINYRNFEEGKYYWRVTPYYRVNSIGYGDSTETASFIIEKKEKLLPPKLSIPAGNSKLSFNTTKENQVTFQWKSDVKTADYQLKVSTKKDFSNIVYETDTRLTRVTNSFTLEQLPEGTYYWKVSRSSEEDNGTVESEVRTFIIEKYIPGETKLLNPPDGYFIEGTKLKSTSFMWKLSKDYEEAQLQSIVQISKSAKFDRDVKEITTPEQNTKDVNLPNGKYYWRVGVTAAGETVYSAARSFSVLPSLATPVITAPVKDAVLAMPVDKQIKISWNTVPEADYYKLKLLDKNDKLVTEFDELTKTSVSIPVEIQTYKCTVQAYTEEIELAPRRNSKTATCSFTLRALQPVQLLSPANNTRIQGLTALRSPVTLSWKPGDKIDRTQLVLKKLQNNGTYKAVKTIDNPKTQVRLDRLDPGTYQWSVNGRGEEGVPLNSDVRTFIVTQIPELRVVKLMEPAQNQIIGSEYLRTHRSVDFDWTAAEGATDYNFVLYQKNSNGTLKKIYEQKNLKVSEVSIKDLSILDIGEFEWNVTAYTHAKDGFEEQHSQTATGNFKIQFALPGKVQTLDPGKLYGE